MQVTRTTSSTEKINSSYECQSTLKIVSIYLVLFLFSDTTERKVEQMCRSPVL